MKDEKAAENDLRYQQFHHRLPLSNLAETLYMPLAEIVFCVVREFLTIPPPGEGLVHIYVRLPHPSPSGRNLECFHIRVGGICVLEECKSAENCGGFLKEDKF